MTTLDATGLTRTRLDERFTELQERMRGIFGDDIALDPDTTDGEALGVFAEMISNLDQLGEDLYHGLDPQQARGVILSRLVQLNGIRRIEGTYSTDVATCVGTANTVVLAGSLISSTVTGAIFSVIADTTIPIGGTIDTDVVATVKGPLHAPAGSLTKIVTPIFGWLSATNASDATVGRSEETDSALRIRRRASTNTPGSVTVDAIYGALINIPSVLQALVIENDTNSTDANGVPSKNIYCVVQGGTDAEVIDVIYRKKAGGIPTYGSIAVTKVDSQGRNHVLHYDHPPATNIWVTVNMHSKAGWPSDGADRIKAAIVAWGAANQSIGEEVVQSLLYIPVNSVPGVSVDSIKIGTAATPTLSVNIAVPFNGLASFDTSRIVVNVTP